jgi:hypothetical protein
VTGDETWVFYHTPESKQQSLQWHYTHVVVEKAGGRLLWLVPRPNNCLDNAGDYVEK